MSSVLVFNSLWFVQCKTLSTNITFNTAQIYSLFSLSVPSQCFLENGTYGQCTNIQQCPSIYKFFLDGKEIKDICGYSGAFPIVCCPSISATGNIYDKINDKNSPGAPNDDSKYLKYLTSNYDFFQRDIKYKVLVICEFVCLWKENHCL